MFIPLMLAVTALVAAPHPAPVSPGIWVPLNAYVGYWRATLQTSDGKVAVTRQYVPSQDNQQLEVTEQVGRKHQPWAVVAYDDSHGGLVLQKSDGDGDPVIMYLQEVSGDGTRLEFVSDPESGASPVERITFQRHGWNDFVERQEVADDGETFTLVSEVLFHRVQ